MFSILWLFVVGSFGQILVDAQDQRIAPGVPPQQYQQHHIPGGQQMHQQVPQQQIHNQQQQQQFQQQQQQFQQQQVPAQHQQHPAQQQHQQIPNQHAQQQGHDHGHNPPQVLNTGNIQNERGHIAEHMDVPIDTSKMTEQELQYHYFKMHDADNNNKLDGCELMKSLIHWHEHDPKEPGTNNGEKVFDDDEFRSLIDPILNMDDLNKDGFIDYPEFVKAQTKAAASGQR